MGTRSPLAPTDPFSGTTGTMPAVDQVEQGGHRFNGFKAHPGVAAGKNH
jgi:hypothetical protein